MNALLKKILITSAIGIVLGLGVGYATGLLLPVAAGALSSVLPFTFAGASTFAADTVALFFGLSGGLMGAANTIVDHVRGTAPSTPDERSASQTAETTREQAASSPEHAPNMPPLQQESSAPATPQSAIFTPQHGGTLQVATPAHVIH
ncbi:MAG: hypothetical protein K2Q12_02020 [Rickettsiales bacterium]|nr:hypothetical protein [Rickettsiales bacterium]